LEATAWSEDGVVQALRHRTRPQWGVQFHPESIASDEAPALLRNFATLTVEWNGQNKVKPADPGWALDEASHFDVPAKTSTEITPLQPATDIPASPRRLLLDTDELTQTISDAHLFTGLFGGEPEAVWLDGNMPGNSSSRFSIMGAPTGPLSKTATASVPDGTVTVRTSGAVRSGIGSREEPRERAVVIETSGFFDWLEAELASTQVELAATHAAVTSTNEGSLICRSSSGSGGSGTSVTNSKLRSARRISTSPTCLTP
ncbi:MAG: glutamine amidotransferase-related protein, partial [Brevibacterium aurantiacum]